MDRLRSTEAFIRVVQAGSFTKAAESLRMPRSTVSTLILGLEAQLGVRLLQRTTRRMSLTYEGKLFFDRCQRLLFDFEETNNLFQQDGAPSGKLKIDVPSRIGRLLMAPALPAFFAAYPDISIEMGVSDRPINLVAEGVDAAIRAGDPVSPDLVVRPLGELAMATCASPGYLERHGTPVTPADLDRHAAVAYVSPHDGRISYLALAAESGAQDVLMTAQVSVNNAEAYIACAVAGLGLIQVPAYDIRHYLASGALIEILSSHRPPPIPLAILYPAQRQMSKRLSVFIAWAERVIQEHVALAA